MNVIENSKNEELVEKICSILATIILNSNIKQLFFEKSYFPRMWKALLKFKDNISMV